MTDAISWNCIGIFIFFRVCVRYSCLASPSSLNATLKDEQKLASGDFWSRDICCFSCSRPRHWRGEKRRKKKRKKKKLKAASAGSYKLSFPLGTCGTNGRTESGTNSCLHSGGSLGSLQAPHLLGNIFQRVCCQLWTFLGPFCTLSSDVVDTRRQIMKIH